MRVLVTGANGFLGTGIVKQLLNDGVEVIATDIKNDSIDKRAKTKCANIFEIDNPYIFFEKPDAVLHLAWRDGFVHNSINHILDLSKRYNFLTNFIDNNVGKIAALGSMHEIGFYEGSINENTPTNPQSLYGISKDALRKSIELKCKEKNVHFQWLRGFYIVSNSERGCSIFSKIVQASLNKEKNFPFTMGLNQFDFLDYEVFCKYVAHTVEQNEINGIINICSGRPEKLSDRVEKFIKENDYNITLNYGAFPERPYDSKAIWGDDFKIKMIEKLYDKG